MLISIRTKPTSLPPITNGISNVPFFCWAATVDSRPSLCAEPFAKWCYVLLLETGLSNISYSGTKVGQLTLGSLVTLGILNAANDVLALVVLSVLAFIGDRRLGRHLEQALDDIFVLDCNALARP